jgi:hypothetical protein
MVVAVIVLGLVVLLGAALIARQRQRDQQQWEEAFPSTTANCEPSEHCGNASCATEGGSCAARLERALAERLIQAERTRLHDATSTNVMSQFALLLPWPVVAAVAILSHAVDPWLGLGALLLEIVGIGCLARARAYAKLLAGGTALQTGVGAGS